MKINLRVPCLFVVLAVVLSGCASGEISEKQVSSGTNQAHKIFKKQLPKKVTKITSGQRLGLIETHKTFYLGGDAERINTSHVVPDKYNKNIILRTSISYSPQALATMLQDKYGIFVAMSPDLDVGEKPTNKVPQGSNNNKLGNRVPGGLRPSHMGLKFSPHHYSGNISGLMTLIASEFDASWKYIKNRDRFQIYRFETKTYNLPLFKKISNVDIAKSGATGLSTGSSTGPSTGSSSAKGKGGDEEKKIMGIIKTLTSKNGKYAFDPITKTLLVTDRPENLDKISKFIKKVRDRLLTQIVLNIKTYRVRLNKGNRYGFSWDAFFKNLSKYAIGFKNIAQVPGVGFNGSPGHVSFTVNKTAIGNLGKYSGSNAIFDALSEQGDVSIDTSMNVTTMSGRPAPIYAIREIGFLKSVTQSVIGGVGTTGTVTSQLEPGTVEDGVSIIALPTVLDGGDILLQLKLSFSTLLDLQSASSGGQTIQTPLMSRFKQSPKVKLSNGESYVISGYKSRVKRKTKSGMLSPDTWFLGGQKEDTDNYEMTVLVITPQLVRL